MIWGLKQWTGLAGALLVASGLSTAAIAEPAVTTATANLRAGPGAQFGRIATLPPGAVVNLIRCRVSWCEVTYRGLRGFVSASLIDDDVDVPPPPRVYVPPPVYIPPPVYVRPPVYGRPYDPPYRPDYRPPYRPDRPDWRPPYRPDRPDWRPPVQQDRPAWRPPVRPDESYGRPAWRPPVQQDRPVSRPDRVPDRPWIGRDGYERAPRSPQGNSTDP